MKLTNVPNRVTRRYSQFKQLVVEDFKIAEELSKESPSAFCKLLLGFLPYSYQFWLNEQFIGEQKELPKKRMIVCKSRQIGISIWQAVLCLWFSYYNKLPSGVHDVTQVSIVSKSDVQAKKLMREVNKLLFNADIFIEEKYGVHKYFESRLQKERGKGSLSVYHVDWKNGGCMKCFPPTDKIRGESNSLVCVDEAAFVDDEVIHESIEPTLSATDGNLILVSTPNGQRGHFFETFDPFDTLLDHEFSRYWFDWNMSESSVQKRVIKNKKKHSLSTGNFKSFQQEYEALFTVDSAAFFDPVRVDAAADETLSYRYEWHNSPCSVGIDWGQNNSETVITVKVKEGNKLKTIFQWGEVGFDENLLFDKSFEHSIHNLSNRYDVHWWNVDDCSQGYRSIKEMENLGLPVCRRLFKMTEKNRMYYGYRSALYRYNISYPKECSEMMAQMKSLEEVSMKVTTSIQKPKNGRDDRIDSEVIASMPFLDEDNDSFSSGLVELPEKKVEGLVDSRFVDSEWERLKLSDTVGGTGYPKHLL